MTVTLPRAQLEPAALNVQHSYVCARQQGLANRIGNFFSGNPSNQQAVYEAAQQKIQNAARPSPLLPEAQKNTQSMPAGMLRRPGRARCCPKRRRTRSRCWRACSGRRGSSR